MPTCHLQPWRCCQRRCLRGSGNGVGGAGHGVQEDSDVEAQAPGPGYSLVGDPASPRRRTVPTGPLATLGEFIAVCVSSAGDSASVFWPCCFPCRPLFTWWRLWGWGSLRPWLLRSLLVVTAVLHGAVVGSLGRRRQVGWAVMGALVLLAGLVHWVYLCRAWAGMWFRTVGLPALRTHYLRCCTSTDMDEEPVLSPATRAALVLAAPSLASSRGAAVVMGAWFGPVFGAVTIHTALGLFANSGPGAWQGAGRADVAPFVLSLLGACPPV
jgi:hypothetical protein